MNRGGEPAGRGRAVRGLPRRRGRDEGPAGHDPHRRHRRRQAAGAHVAQELRHEHALNPALGLRAIRWSLVRAGHVPPAVARHPARQRLRQGAHPDPDGGAPERGQDDASRPWRGRASSSTMPAGRTAQVEVGAMIEVPAAALMPDRVPAPLRLRVHRHQRPDPVHAGDRPCRRGGGAPLRPLAPGRAAADRRHDRQRQCRGQAASACAARWPATPAFTELLLAMGLRSFSMHPAQIAVDQAARPARRHAPACPAHLARGAGSR